MTQRPHGIQASARATRKRLATYPPPAPPTRGRAVQDDFHNRRWQDGPPAAWAAQHDRFRDQVLLRQDEAR